MILRNYRLLISLAAVSILLAAGCGLRHVAAIDKEAGPATARPGLFTDMRAGSGIDFPLHMTPTPINIEQSVGHGAALIDYDQDGLLDIVLLGPDTVKIYHNDGNWHFSDVTARMGIRQKGYWQGVAVGDYDNDGYPDLYIAGYGCSALYHNEQGKGFREVTREAGLETLPPDKDGNPDWRTTAAFVDVNQDGLLDLYVCRYARFGPKTVQLCAAPGGGRTSCAPEMYKGETGSLYINQGGGRFRDETKARGLSAHSGRGLGIAIADYDGDGNIDIAIANDELPGNLFHNKGHGFFEDKGVDSGTAFDNAGRTHGGMGIDWGDIENNGRPALFVTTFENEIKTLYRNAGQGIFIDISQQAGIVQGMQPYVGWGARFIDYDRDGLLDLAVANGHVMDNVALQGKGAQYAQPMLLYHNVGNARFERVDPADAPPLQQNLVARALCIGDIDNDGRQDILISNIEGQPLLLRNVGQNTNHWLGLQLVGTKSNRMGIGCEARVEAGSMKLLRTCSTTGSTLSAQDPRLYFGLGSSETAQKVTLRWPSGHIDTFTGVSADRYYIAKEGAAALTPVGTNIARQGAVALAPVATNTGH
jgi:hypothetical protein